VLQTVQRDNLCPPHAMSGAEAREAWTQKKHNDARAQAAAAASGGMKRPRSPTPGADANGDAAEPPHESRRRRDASS